MYMDVVLLYFFQCCTFNLDTPNAYLQEFECIFLYSIYVVDCFMLYVVGVLIQLSNNLDLVTIFSNLTVALTLDFKIRNPILLIVFALSLLTNYVCNSLCSSCCIDHSILDTHTVV